MVVGLALLRRSGDKGLQRAAQGVKRKIADVLPREMLRSLDQTALQVFSHGITPPTLVDLSLLRAAIRAERKLLLVYKDSEGHQTRRTVLPLAVFYYVEIVVLAAWCELRRDFRHFRVDRISACSGLGEFFKTEAEALRAWWRDNVGNATPE